MYTDYFLKMFDKNSEEDAIIWQGRNYSYQWLVNSIDKYINIVDSHKIRNGSIVALEGDFSPCSISLLFALIEQACIIVPLTHSSLERKKKILSIAQVEYVLKVDKYDSFTFENISETLGNKLYEKIKQRQHPGLVLFTSGSSGEPKAAVHDFVLLLNKFKTKRKAFRTLNFLLFDHWGGLNTMFHVLSNGGVLIGTKNRSPDYICNLIEKNVIELLPTSPTFLNLLLLSESVNKYDLSSLKVISYGTEPMPENTLKRLNQLFPSTKILQTYGLIELGVLRTKSKGNDSLLVKIGGEGYEVRVEEGMLEIKASSAMLGYLNAPSPFTDDGWFKTYDMVEEHGKYIKIIGRKSEVINVGGEKVYPQEVENVIQSVDNVGDATVYGENNPIVGKIVCAKVSMIKNEDKKFLKRRIKKFCFIHLDQYKVPMKIIISKNLQYGKRFKKLRKSGTE